jgi:uncharacterized protein YhbP (UPF0306 family)
MKQMKIAIILFYVYRVQNIELLYLEHKQQEHSLLVVANVYVAEKLSCMLYNIHANIKEDSF